METLNQKSLSVVKRGQKILYEIKKEELIPLAYYIVQQKNNFLRLCLQLTKDT
jgi:hypothetical protein